MSAENGTHVDKLIDSIMGVPDDALPAVTAAIMRRHQDRLAGPARAKLLRTYANRPLGRWIWFAPTADNVEPFAMFKPVLDLAEPGPAHLLIHEGVSNDEALQFLRNATDLIESGALHDRDWNLAYGLRDLIYDDIPF